MDARCRLAHVISIHAPPRGATADAFFFAQFYKFQFTPLREGRPEKSLEKKKSISFQFTPLREGRLIASGKISQNQLISIHAPPRGATKLPSASVKYSEFQFTPLREGRPDFGRGLVDTYHFNSRPSARGDPDCFLAFQRLDAFQFTPLREGRRMPL